MNPEFLFPVVVIVLFVLIYLFVFYGINRGITPFPVRGIYTFEDVYGNKQSVEVVVLESIRGFYKVSMLDGTIFPVSFKFIEIVKKSAIKLI